MDYLYQMMCGLSFRGNYKSLDFMINNNIMTKKFIAQIGNNNSVKVFDAYTGSLYRVISVDGQLTTPPIVVENDLTVNVKTASGQVTKVYNVSTGSLKHVFNQD